tara:strand:- start:465 stop:602 length:138 start_codon:yes stop_codon:yes gene_type:complete
MNYRDITKKYFELLDKAENATGRKEFVSYSHKAAKLKLKYKINIK